MGAGVPNSWISFLMGIGLWLGPVVARGQAVVPTAPARYWVTLRDKNGVCFDPEQYFTFAAQARRARQHLPAYEASDLPVRADYVAAITAQVDTVTLVSRWFNAVACRATPAQAAVLRGLPGVATVVAWPLARGGVAAHQLTSSPVHTLTFPRPV